VEGPFPTGPNPGGPERLPKAVSEPTLAIRAEEPREPFAPVEPLPRFKGGPRAGPKEAPGFGTPGSRRETRLEELRNQGSGRSAGTLWVFLMAFLAKPGLGQPKGFGLRNPSYLELRRSHRPGGTSPSTVFGRPPSRSAQPRQLL